MPNHTFSKAEVVILLEHQCGKTFGEIDNQGIFEQVRRFSRQKGIAGKVIEQCVFEYPQDSAQRPDLIIVDNNEQINTELKTTGMRLLDRPRLHYVAKEPMSITGVGVYDIPNQVFETSHFWRKLEHLLIVYYHYSSNHTATPFEYKEFSIKGYEFHEFSQDEVAGLKQDWECVRSLCNKVVSRHPGERNQAWKDEVKEDYIENSGQLRRVLSYIDLAPKFPPRFRLKKPVVSSFISNHFGYELEQLPGRYNAISDIDRKCREITREYSGKTIGELARLFGISLVSSEGLKQKKNIGEEIVVKMFGSEGAKKINEIEIFERFGLIAKTVVMSSVGARTEDMKLFRMDFDDIRKDEVEDDDGTIREFTFEDSDVYSFFAENELLCILFQEPDNEYITINGITENVTPNSLSANRFVGFKRLVFSDEFIDTSVRSFWEDTRNKVINGTLEDIVQRNKNGTVKRISNGEISSAPNFMKSRENVVFMRGSGRDSSLVNKTENVNGIAMLPQYVWIKGAAIIEELKMIPNI